MQYTIRNIGKLSIFDFDKKVWSTLNGYAFRDIYGHCIIIVYGEDKKDDFMTEETIVRENLMTEPGYTPYCGSYPSKIRGCSNPRSKWDKKLEQFVCPECGWISQFPKDFIKRYKEKWNI